MSSQNSTAHFSDITFHITTTFSLGQHGGEGANRIPNTDVFLCDQFIEHVLDWELKQFAHHQPTATLLKLLSEACCWVCSLFTPVSKIKPTELLSGKSVGSQDGAAAELIAPCPNIDVFIGGVSMSCLVDNSFMVSIIN